MKKIFETKSHVWVYDGPAAWHFAIIDTKTSKKIKDLRLGKRGWGSVPVNVTIGKTKWKTSIFPDKDNVYLLPIKKEVRKLESIKVGSNLKIKLEIITDFFEEQI